MKGRFAEKTFWHPMILARRQSQSFPVKLSLLLTYSILHCRGCDVTHLGVIKDETEQNTVSENNRKTFNKGNKRELRLLFVKETLASALIVMTSVHHSVVVPGAMSFHSLKLWVRVCLYVRPGEGRQRKYVSKMEHNKCVLVCSMAEALSCITTYSQEISFYCCPFFRLFIHKLAFLPSASRNLDRAWTSSSHLKRRKGTRFTCVYVIQQQGSTWLESSPQNSSSSSNKGPQTSVG